MLEVLHPSIPIDLRLAKRDIVYPVENTFSSDDKAEHAAMHYGISKRPFINPESKKATGM